MGKLADLIAQDFGGPIDAKFNRETASVGLTPTMVFRLDADRVGATVVNLSATKIYIGPFRDPSATKGMLLGPNGGQLNLDYRDDYLTVGAEWFAIAIKTAAPVFTQELIAQAMPAPPGAT